jgi:hypothetical protein
VTDVLYYVKSRGQRTMKIQLPPDPVKLWAVSVNGAPVTARQADDATLIPLPGDTDPNTPVEVRLRLGKTAVNESFQGVVSALNVQVPKGLTVTAVTGPVGSWQFDADSGGLTLAIEPAQSQAFDVLLETQRGLDPLPVDVTLAPLRVVGANGEIGLVAVAFGPEARPEKVEPKIMTIVNPGDFDASRSANHK